MRTLILALLITHFCQAQVYPVPVQILDSLVFEVKQGRECTITAYRLIASNDSLRSQLVISSKLIEGLRAERASYELITATYAREIAATREESRLEHRKLRRGLIRAKLIIVSEAIICVLLIL